MMRALLLALALGSFLCGPALALLPEPAGPKLAQPATECIAVAAAYERGYWAGWRQHAQVVGGGL